MLCFSVSYFDSRLNDVPVGSLVFETVGPLVTSLFHLLVEVIIGRQIYFHSYLVCSGLQVARVVEVVVAEVVVVNTMATRVVLRVTVASLQIDTVTTKTELTTGMTAEVATKVTTEATTKDPTTEMITVTTA